MKTVCSIVKIIETVMRAIVAVVAVIIIMFAAYSLYDTFYINQHAFSSYELKQFKPIPVEVNTDNGKGNGDGSGTDYDQDSFTRLKEVNEDARGWITIYDTNIDYPVVQGEDDLEYASKDIYGKTSITGAIYLKTDNAEDLSDPYNVIFGHHMDNGAMFGSLDRFTSEQYFRKHQQGTVVTGDKVYDIMCRYLFLREKLKPYIKQITDQAAETGAPIIRPLFFDFPEDPKAWEDCKAHMFGPDLLVAPVTEPDVDHWNVYLPAGTDWIESATGRIYTGGQEVSAYAPLDTIPVFIRDGADVEVY